jgi:hypothetical protein
MMRSGVAQENLQAGTARCVQIGRRQFAAAKGAGIGLPGYFSPPRASFCR